MCRILSSRDSISVPLKKLLQETGEEVKLCISLQQREQTVWTSKIRYPVKECSILCLGSCQPLGSQNSILLYASQLSGAKPVSLFTLLLAFPQLLCNHFGGWQHPLDNSFGNPHSHLEARSCWWLLHFLFNNMARDIFISCVPMGKKNVHICMWIYIKVI